MCDEAVVASSILYPYCICLLFTRTELVCSAIQVMEGIMQYLKYRIVRLKANAFMIFFLE